MSSENNNKARNIIVGMVGVLTLSAVSVMWRTTTSISRMETNIAEVVRRIAENETKVSNLEKSGSVNFKAHESLDDERVNNLKMRAARVEDAILLLQSNQDRISKLEERMKSLEAIILDVKQLLSEHTKLKPTSYLLPNPGNLLDWWTNPPMPATLIVTNDWSRGYLINTNLLRTL